MGTGRGQRRSRHPGLRLHLGGTALQREGPADPEPLPGRKPHTSREGAGPRRSRAAGGQWAPTLSSVGERGGERIGTGTNFKQLIGVHRLGELCGGLSQGGEVVGGPPRACWERETLAARASQGLPSTAQALCLLSCFASCGRGWSWAGSPCSHAALPPSRAFPGGW